MEYQCFAYAMLHYFNIALLPTDQSINDQFTQQAQIIAPYANGHLLGQGTKPHITLCQFKTDTPDCVTAIWNFVSGLTAPDIITVDRFAIREGLEQHAGFDWVEWWVKNNFTALQKSVYDRLADDPAYLVPLTAPESYNPHVTLGRVFENTVSEHITLSQEEFAPFSVTLALGQSTINGEWVKTLYRQ